MSNSERWDKKPDILNDFENYIDTKFLKNYLHPPFVIGGGIHHFYMSGDMANQIWAYFNFSGLQYEHSEIFINEGLILVSDWPGIAPNFGG